MPIGRIVSGIDNCVHTLSHLPDAAERASQSILTSDTRRRLSSQLESDGHSLSLGGFAKGAGMIEPNMATSVGISFTDVKMKQGLLQEIFSASVRKSFNRISIDGDMSTNDTVLLLANGASGRKSRRRDRKPWRIFTTLSIELVWMLRKDCFRWRENHESRSSRDRRCSR